MKITLISDEEIRAEESLGTMLTIEADSHHRSYSPYHMLASGLAVCTFSVLASWASHAGLNAEGLTINVRWSFVEDPHRVGRIDLRFDWPNLPSERRKAAKRAASLCPVHNTFKIAPEISIEAS